MGSLKREPITFLILVSYKGTNFIFLIIFLPQLFCNIVATLLQRNKQAGGHTMEKNLSTDTNS